MGINWVAGALIEKSDGLKIVTITSGNNSISLKLNTESNKVIMTKEDNEIHEFIAKSERGRLNIYEME